jgi:hypothetical protein
MHFCCVYIIGVVLKKVKRDMAMRSVKRKVLVSVVVWVVFGSVCALAGSGRMTAKEKRARALELLDKYAETQDKQQSFILKSETSVVGSNSALKIRNRKENRYGELRFDGNRGYLRENKWGESASGFLPKDNPNYTSWLWDNEKFLSNARGLKGDDAVDPPTVIINKEPDDFTKTGMISGGYSGHALMGYFHFRPPERIDIILRRSVKISMRDKRESVQGVKCFIIDAITQDGKYTLWLDPEHGYNIAKAVGNYEHIHMRNLWETFFTLKNVRFRKVDDMWVPMEGDWELKTNMHKGHHSWEKRHHRIIEIILNPNHDALGSFVPDDIVNGSKVYIVSHNDSRDGSIEYTWQDGELVDENDKVVDLDKLKVKKKK